MNSARTTRLTKIFVVAATAAVLLLVLTACGGEEPAKTETTAPAPAGATALASITAAESALSTMAPDARLLIVQTAEVVTATSTPVWAYLFGSPESDMSYLVYVVDGEAMPASEYGEAGLSEKQWAEVPDTNTWEIDSDAAYEKALAVSGSTGTPAGWFMGFQTYVPETEDDAVTSKALTWYVNFFSADGAVSGDTIEVDANSGETSPTAAPE